MSWFGYKRYLLEGLNKCLERFSPDLVLYVAGVDIHASDKLGRLSIDDEGLFEREMTVLNFLRKGIFPLQRLWEVGTQMTSTSLLIVTHLLSELRIRFGHRDGEGRFLKWN